MLHFCNTNIYLLSELSPDLADDIWVTDVPHCVNEGDIKGIFEPANIHLFNFLDISNPTFLRDKRAIALRKKEFIYFIMEWYESCVKRKVLSRGVINFSDWTVQYFDFIRSKTNSEISARQQVGRGLRLCVNNQGSRITKEFCNGDDIKFYDINCLDVVVGADESNFIANLQKEINANSFILDVESKITEEYLCNILNIKNKQARKILDLLDDYKIIDENNIIQKPINEALETSEFANKINTILKENNGIDIEKFKNAFISNSNNKHTQIKLAKENDEVGIKTNLAQEFKELWQTINKTVKLT